MKKARASTLERIVTDAQGFGLDTATPVQRAILRAADGVPLGELWELEDVKQAFGGCLPDPTKPDTVIILAAIRGYKSGMAAAKALEVSQSADVRGLRKGDQLTLPVLSVDKKGAQAVFKHLLENMEARPDLKRLIVKCTSQSIFIRHPSGIVVEVRITAIARYGSTLVGTWLAGCIFDEAPRMNGAEDGVKNLDESLSAIAGRMRPGAQIWMIGSPYAPFGPVYELVNTHFGRRNPEVLVVRGTGPQLNPVWWTPERIDKMKRSTDPRTQRAYVTDVLGQFCDAEDQLFPSQIVDGAMRETPEVIFPQPGHFYTAAMDPAMRGNAWTLVVLGCSGLNELGQPKFYVAMAKQWRGQSGAPLIVDEVFREIADEVKPYNVDEVHTDQWAIDALSVIAEQVGLTLIENTFTPVSRVELIETIRITLEERRLELSPSREVRQDLLRISRRLTQAAVTIDMPRTADGRHCDFAPALGLALKHAPEPPSVARTARDKGLERALAAVAARQAGDSAHKRVVMGGLNG